MRPSGKVWTGSGCTQEKEMPRIMSVVAKGHILTRGTVEPTPTPYRGRCHLGVGVRGRCHLGVGVRGGCHLERVPFGAGAIWTGCYLGRVSFGAGVIWTGCHFDWVHPFVIIYKQNVGIL